MCFNTRTIATLLDINPHLSKSTGFFIFLFSSENHVRQTDLNKSGGIELTFKRLFSNICTYHITSLQSHLNILARFIYYHLFSMLMFED